MALSDPQSVKIGATTTSLPRVSVGDMTAAYKSADGRITFKASTAEANRLRQVIRLDVSKITEDPFISTQNVEVSMSTYIVIDRPPAGYTNAEALETVVGFLEMITNTEDLILTKVLAAES